jgi:hypothetical protein
MAESESTETPPEPSKNPAPPPYNPDRDLIGYMERGQRDTDTETR